MTARALAPHAPTPLSLPRTLVGALVGVLLLLASCSSNGPTGSDERLPDALTGRVFELVAVDGTPVPVVYGGFPAGHDYVIEAHQLRFPMPGRFELEGLIRDPARAPLGCQEHCSIPVPVLESGEYTLTGSTVIHVVLTNQYEPPQRMPALLAGDSLHVTRLNRALGEGETSRWSFRDVTVSTAVQAALARRATLRPK